MVTFSFSIPIFDSKLFEKLISNLSLSQKLFLDKISEFNDFEIKFYFMAFAKILCSWWWPEKAIKFYCSCHKEDENQLGNKILEIRHNFVVSAWENFKKFRNGKMQQKSWCFKVACSDLQLLNSFCCMLKVFRAWRAPRRCSLACFVIKLCHLRMLRSDE